MTVAVQERPRKKAAPGPSIEAWRAKNPLRRWIDAQDTEVKTIAQRLGVTRQQLYNYLSGYSLPDLKRAVKIKDITGVALEDWVGWYTLKPKAAKAAHRAIRETSRGESK